MEETSAAPAPAPEIVAMQPRPCRPLLGSRKQHLGLALDRGLVAAAPAPKQARGKPTRAVLKRAK